MFRFEIIFSKISFLGILLLAIYHCYVNKCVCLTFRIPKNIFEIHGYNLDVSLIYDLYF